MDQLRWEYKIALLFSVGSVVLIVVLFGEWLFAAHHRDKILAAINSPVSADYQVDPLPEFDFLQYPADHYAETVDRPLFIEGRRPLELSEQALAELEGGADGKTAAEAVGEFKLQLIGSMDTPEGVVALFENPAPKEARDKFKQIAVDEEYLGWKIDAIRSDRVIISSGGATQEILLRKSSPPETQRAADKQGKPERQRRKQKSEHGRSSGKAGERRTPLSAEERKRKLEERRKMLKEKRQNTWQ